MATFTLSLSGCSSPADPVAEIEAIIQAMQAALAERDNDAFADHLAGSFLGGQNDRMDRDKADVLKIWAGYLLPYRNIRVLVTQLNIEVDEVESSLAYVSCKVAVTGTNRSLSESGGLYVVEGEWRHYRGDWKLLGFSWR